MAHAFLQLTSLGLLASGALGYQAKFDCGTSVASHATSHFNQTVQELHNGGPNGAPGAQNRTAALFARDGGATIQAHFHIVTKGSESGQITQDMANNQIKALNSAYNQLGFTFNLADTDFTSNDNWAVGASPNDDQAMKSSLRKGSYSELNIYFQTDLSGGVLGQCSLPSDIGPQPVDKSTYSQDGCNVNANTMPGGQMQGYSQGMTAVHETGHWLGLLHTFEGYTCDGDGDYIDDTPAEAESTDGCPNSPAKNTCQNRPGTDPIHNYMDYSTDACYSGFTNDQQSRMQNMWSMYRSGK